MFPALYGVHPPPPENEIPPNQRSLVPRQPDAIQMKRYATSVDERNFLTVFEYMLNGQWIMWDYYTGYVHFTGIWKAIGYSKADIVKLVDNSPELAPVIRRVRGGFLKIQGTWLPFATARDLAARTCYHIRYALVPIFGSSFPDSCLREDQPGFGQLLLHPSSPSKNRRRRKSTVGLSGPNANTKNDTSPHRRIHQHRHRHSDPGAGMLRQPRNIFDNRMNNGSPATMEPPHVLRPPSLPTSITFDDRNSIIDRPEELLEVLQATRSLQQISIGNAGHGWSTNRRSLGGGFEHAGRLWQWDGLHDLSIVGSVNPQSQDSPIKVHSELSDNGKPGERRLSLLGCTPRVLPWSPPASPPRHGTNEASLETRTVMNIGRFLS